MTARAARSWRDGSLYGLVRLIEESRSTGLGAWLIAASLVAALCNSALILPLFVQGVTDRLAGRPVPEGRDALLLAALAIGYGAEYTLNQIAGRINARACERLVTAHVEGQIGSEMAAFSRHARGDYAALVAEVIELLQPQQLFMLQSGLVSLLVTLGSVALVARYDPVLLVAALPFMLAICALPIWLASKANSAIEGEAGAFAALGAHLHELVAARRVLHFADEGALRARTGALIDRLHHLQIGKWWIWNISFNLKMTLNLLLYALTLLVGGLLYLEGRIGLGAVVAVYLLVTMLAPKLDAIYKLYNFAQSCSAAYRALDAKLLPVAPRAPLEPAGNPAPLSTLSLRVERFGHPGGPSLLRAVALDLRAGDRCLIMGPSGSGKSTLLDMLAGLIRSEGIDLCIDGRPLRREDLAAYWRRIAFVGNPDLVFDRLSAADNLALYPDARAGSRPDAAAALDWPRFAERAGAALSGGERQRLALLRALERDKSLMLLDEPGSALDAARLHAAFALLASSDAGIVIVASHSPGIEPYFNRVFDLVDGTLVARARVAAPA